MSAIVGYEEPGTGFEEIVGMHDLAYNVSVLGAALTETPVPAPPASVPAPAGTPTSPTSFTAFQNSNKLTVEEAGAMVGRSFRSAAGGVAGALFWKEHRVLGLLGGSTLAGNVPELLMGRDRGNALANLLVAGAGVAAAYHLGKQGKSWGTRGLGYVGAAVVAGIFTAPLRGKSA